MDSQTVVPVRNHEVLHPFLAEHPLARGLDPRHLEKLSNCAAVRDLEPDDYLWRQGDNIEVVYLISTGQVALEIQVPGQGRLEVDLFYGGDFLPWLWLSGEYRRRFDARVLLPAKVIVLDGQCLRKLCDEDYEFGYHLLQRLARATEGRLQQTRVRLMEVQINPAPNRRSAR